MEAIWQENVASSLAKDSCAPSELDAELSSPEFPPGIWELELSEQERLEAVQVILARPCFCTKMGGVGKYCDKGSTCKQMLSSPRAPHAFTFCHLHGRRKAKSRPSSKRHGPNSKRGQAVSPTRRWLDPVRNSMGCDHR